jgi:hypothetical protein
LPIPESSIFSSGDITGIGIHPWYNGNQPSGESHRNTGQCEIGWREIRYRRQKSVHYVRK